MLDSKKYFSMQEIADYLLVSKETIRNWTKKNILPYNKIGRKYLFNKADIDEIVKKLEHERLFKNEIYK